ncbi:hypothetical protein F4680DRAFT_436741 [Xylaria scruposa]|nr:hypothetical protein F4680DRAFT_436741 [Xylaria scruposa]
MQSKDRIPRLVAEIPVRHPVILLGHVDHTYLNIVTLWADSLCINQDDVRKKNTQVPLMGRIYG